MTHPSEGAPVEQPAFDPEFFLASLSGQLTDERAKLVEALVQQPWFQATDPALQHELATLPQTPENNHDGFLEDLVGRPWELGGVRVESLAALERGNYAVTPIFNVRILALDKPNTYEYVSWRHGAYSGVKGLVFIRPNPEAEPTHAVVLIGDKFATGRRDYDMIGGFMDKEVDGVQKVTDRVLVEVRQELGVDDLPVDEVVDLGRVAVDPGMTNNRPGLFAAYITTEDAQRLSDEPMSVDPKELQQGAVVVPLHQLPELIQGNDYSLFHAALLRTLTSPEVGEPTRAALYRTLAVGGVALGGVLGGREEILTAPAGELTDGEGEIFESAYIAVIDRVAAEQGYEATLTHKVHDEAVDAARQAVAASKALSPADSIE